MQTYERDGSGSFEMTNLPPKTASPDLIKNWDQSTLPITKIADINSYFTRLDFLGQGAFGKVYKTTLSKPIGDQPKGTQVAVKIQNLRNKTSEQIARLHNELEILERAKGCPYVNQIYDVLYDSKTKNLYFVLEYLDGKELFEVYKGWGKVVSEDGFFSIVPQLIKGLQCLHNKGIAHRDIKAENVMLTKRGRAIWIDFGLSCATDVVSCGVGLAVGTFATMAPEVIARSITTNDEWKTADLWSFGCLLYELCTRREFPLQKRMYDITMHEKKQTQKGINTLRYLLDKEIENPTAMSIEFEVFPKEDYARIFTLLKVLLVINPKERKQKWLEFIKLFNVHFSQ